MSPRLPKTALSTGSAGPSLPERADRADYRGGLRAAIWLAHHCEAVKEVRSDCQARLQNNLERRRERARKASIHVSCLSVGDGGRGGRGGWDEGNPREEKYEEEQNDRKASFFIPFACLLCFCHHHQQVTTISRSCRTEKKAKGDTKPEFMVRPRPIYRNGKGCSS